MRISEMMMVKNGWLEEVAEHQSVVCHAVLPQVRPHNHIRIYNRIEDMKISDAA